MSEFTMTIDGAPVTAAETFPVLNPATGEAFAEAPDCSPRNEPPSVGGPVSTTAR